MLQWGCLPCVARNCEFPNELCKSSVSHEAPQSTTVVTDLYFQICYLTFIVISDGISLLCSSALVYAYPFVPALSEFANVSMLQEAVGCKEL